MAVEDTEREGELSGPIAAAIEVLRGYLEECEDIAEACAIQETLESLADDYDELGTELAEIAADAEIKRMMGEQ